jgi:hypothetical protein
LQHLLRIFEKVPIFVALASQCLGDELRANLEARDGTVFRHKPNFVDLDTGLSRQRGLQLFRQGTRLGVPTWERARESRELCLCGGWCEVNAGDSRTGQQLRETFFRPRCAERHAIQKDLVSGSP